ncbi:hypothetical protein EON81_06750 [bacterium]|nr:MAG: hypothetical protein EON81_06750 [bacterium]
MTQDPALHERWDLRFSRIEYLPKACPEDPQRFLYSTRIGFGLVISGEGESVGERHRADGIRTSALRFKSDERLSLIREGSGYWQYEPVAEGTRFRTNYDYRVRFGPLGKALDLVFRPLIGWATAWSFDSLRLWAERDIPPELSRLRAAIHAICRMTLAVVWLYHGLVPKLLFPETGERELTRFLGIPEAFNAAFVTGIGIVECLFALSLVGLWHKRWLLALQVPLLLLIPLGLVRHLEVFTRPFTPLSLNLSMAALALCGVLAARDLPRAGNCLRRPLP